jgi:hypothetical protein
MLKTLLIQILMILLSVFNHFFCFAVRYLSNSNKVTFLAVCLSCVYSKNRNVSVPRLEFKNNWYMGAWNQVGMYPPPARL